MTKICNPDALHTKMNSKTLLRLAMEQANKSLRQTVNYGLSGFVRYNLSFNHTCFQGSKQIHIEFWVLD